MSFINRQYCFEDVADQQSAKACQISCMMAGSDYFHCQVANWAAVRHHSLHFTACYIPTILITSVFEQNIPHATQTV